jgi:hypothetical protein
MSKKHFGDVKNDKANMPDSVITSSYKKQKGAMAQENGYVDTNEGLEAAFSKACGKMKKSMKK